MFHNVFTFFSVYNCLDEDFDAPDVAADAELCCALVAGRAGLHPEAWSSHDPLSTWPPHHRKLFVPPTGFPADRSEEWRPWKRRPKPPKPKRPVELPLWWPRAAKPAGTIQLTCDDCNAECGPTLDYCEGQRSEVAAVLRAMGAAKGWTRRRWRDLCPKCSRVPAQEAVG